MLTDKASCITACTSRLCTEACRICTELERKFTSVKYRILIHICYRNFCGRNKEIVCTRYFESILLKFRKLTCTSHRVAVYHKRREYLGIPVFCMGIKIVVNNCSFKMRSGPPVKMKTRSGYFSGCFGIKYSETVSDIPVSLRLKIKIPCLTPTAYLNILAVVCTYRNAFVGEIRYRKKQILYFSLKCIDFFGISLYFVGKLLHLFKNRSSILALFFEFRNLL